MKLMSSKIYLRNVRFHAFHGVLPQEGIVGNDYLVNLVLDYDFSSALKTDQSSGNPQLCRGLSEGKRRNGCAQQAPGACGRQNRP